MGLELKKHVLNISSLNFECKEIQNKAALEQKEQYIKLLEEQLKIRDSILDITQDYIRHQSPSESVNRALMSLKSIEEITAHSIIIKQSKGNYLNRSLPPINTSRIPRLKAISPTSSIHSSTNSMENKRLPKISKKNSKDKYIEGRKRRYAHRIVSVSPGSSDSDESTSSTYVKSERKVQARPAIKKYGTFSKSSTYKG